LLLLYVGCQVAARPRIDKGKKTRSFFPLS
jgi:hypothetical protein